MDRNKLLVIVISVMAFFVIGAGVLWALTNNKEEASDTTQITNYGKEINDLPAETRVGIERSLYGIIKLNNEDIDPVQVKDATIRDGSNSQDKNNLEQYTGNFIIDIPSLRQSYNLDYKYSQNDDGFDSGYPFLATCIEEEDLIYEKFDCKDQTYSNEPSDPNLQKLPYKAANYTIQAKGDKGVIVQIMLTHTTRTDKFFKSYAKAANEWMTSNGFNLEDYAVEYRDVQNKPLTVKLD